MLVDAFHEAKNGTSVFVLFPTHALARHAASQFEDTFRCTVYSNLLIGVGNPAREVERYRMKNPDGIHTWTEAEIRKFQERWPEGTTADLVIALMLYTGAARSDAVQLGPRNIKDGRLQYERQKMKGRDGVLVDIPLHPELQRRLEPLMDQDTFLQTDWGKPRSANGLTQSIRGWVEAAKLPHCTSHGLRKACARRLAEAGATPH
ncbi:MAG: site-specific integrase [Pseudomonadota bacterium]